jgi:hypothetical protein
LRGGSNPAAESGDAATASSIATTNNDTKAWFSLRRLNTPLLAFDAAALSARA